MFFEAGYVILLPIAAILFMNLGRHPCIGVSAAFAGISFGYGANIVINGVDNVLVNYTQNATKILDQNYQVSLSGNLIFMIFATLLIAYLGMIITEKYVVPKLGKYNLEEDVFNIDNSLNQLKYHNNQRNFAQDNFDNVQNYMDKNSESNIEEDNSIYTEQLVNGNEDYLFKFKTKKYFITENGKKRRIKKKRKFK